MSTKRRNSEPPEARRTPAERGDAERGDAEPAADRVEAASTESFPASDPPAWVPLHPGAPGEHPDAPDR